MVSGTVGSCWLIRLEGCVGLQRDNPPAALALLTLLAVDLGRKLALCGQQLTLLEDL